MMHPVSEPLLDLLRTNTMAADTLDATTIAHMILGQMKVSLYSGASSIPMLPTFLKPFGTVKDDETVAVIRMTAEEIAISFVKFTGGVPEVTQGDAFPIPGREYPAPLADILYAAAELLEPDIEGITRAVLCTAFSITYDGKGDGTIRRFPGSMKVSEYEGISVLAAFAEELRSRELTVPALTLIHEAGANQLAGAVVTGEKRRFLGLQWGDAIDVSFAAPGTIAVRQPGISGDLMLYSEGVSAAECVPFGACDHSTDRDCYAPGRDLLLKMASTDYLGDSFRLMMIKAAERKMLSFPCSRDILSHRHLDLAPVIEFLAEPEGSNLIAGYCRDEHDREIAIVIGEAVMQRAAILIAAAVTATLMLSGAGKDPESPAVIGAAGKALDIPVLREALEYQLKTFTQDKLGLHAELCIREDMTAIGAAAASFY